MKNVLCEIVYLKIIQNNNIIISVKILNKMNTVDVESKTNNNDNSKTGDGPTFINKLLGEMKNQFNKTELLPETPKSDVTDMEFSLNSSPLDVSNKLDSLEPDLQSTNDGASKDLMDDEELSRTSDEKTLAEELDGKPRIVMLFKKPNGETAKTKDISPSRRSLRHKNNVTDDKDESVLKRSSRRRSKDCTESVLQSAIARKEKSYNESSKPQRLTRQLKPTQKILENLAIAKQEKIKVKSSRMSEKTKQDESDYDQQSTEESNGLSGHSKKTKKHTKSKRSTKRLKIEENNESEQESDSDQSMSTDNEVTLESIRSTRRSQRLSSNRSKEIEECSGANVAEQSDIFPNDPESSSVTTELIASRLCLCTEKTTLYLDAEENEEVYCNAVDSISDKLIGCTRKVNVKEESLLRPSRRVPYIILCDLHRNRLLRHNCCPTCGVFCTQGKFSECSSRHQYHRECQISVGNMDCCPHCGITAPTNDVLITMHCSTKPVFLPVQKSYYPSAKMSFPKIKEKPPACTTPPLIPLDTFQIENFNNSEDCTFTENDLIDAVRDGDLKKITQIIASETVDPHFKITNFGDGNLLHYAAQNGSLAVGHLLVSINLEIDELDKEQNTPLMLATISNNNEFVRYLVKVGASVTIKGTDGMTALHVAAKCGNLAACKILLRAATTVENFVNARDDGGWTPLVWACEHGYVDVASYLILCGADPSLRDVEHNEALHWAAFSGSSRIVELLLNEGCDVNTINAHGETPLHIGAREDRYNCIIMLLARGADVSLLNKNDETPLECVPQSGQCFDVIALNVQLQGVTRTRAQYKTILSNDISKGRESNPIQCSNVIDDEKEPKDYIYITKTCITSDDLKISSNISMMHSCNCDERCATEDCDCGKLSVKCWYDEEGKLTADFNFFDAPLIFECNEACSCNAITCRNRVVQKGLAQRFQLCKTDGKGWGIKTLRFVPSGSFVCEYIGEILTDVEADQREDDSYLFDLDNRETESFCIDAKQYGNFARFINHSCDPNLYPIKVFIDHQDMRFPRIALFAKRDISANEELSFDYGDKFWLVKYKSFTCQCGASQCRYSDEAIRQTINNYNNLLESS